MNNYLRISEKLNNGSGRMQVTSSKNSERVGRVKQENTWIIWGIKESVVHGDIFWLILATVSSPFQFLIEEDLSWAIRFSSLFHTHLQTYKTLLIVCSMKKNQSFEKIAFYIHWWLLVYIKLHGISVWLATLLMSLKNILIFCFLIYFSFGGKLFYKFVLVSAVQQCTSAIIICVSLPSPPPF